MNLKKVLTVYFILLNTIMFSQKLKEVYPIANNSTISEINPYLTYFWYSGWNNKYEGISSVQSKIEPIWLTYIETDFEKFSNVVAYNFQYNNRYKIKISDKFLISDTTNKTINNFPKIENFFGKPIAIWEGRDSLQTDLYYSICSDSIWSIPKKITNDSLVETSTVFFTKDSWTLNNNNESNYLFWISDSSINYTSLSTEFSWNETKTLYKSEFPITNLKTRNSYKNNHYLLFEENPSEDSIYVKGFIKLKDSTDWIGPFTILAVEDSNLQMSINIYENWNNNDDLLFTWTDNGSLLDTVFSFQDSIQFKGNTFDIWAEFTNNTIFTSNTLVTGGCVVSPYPFFLIASNNDSSSILTLGSEQYNSEIYRSKNSISELALSGLGNNRYFAAWTEYDSKQYDIYIYPDYISIGDVNGSGSIQVGLLAQNYPNPFNPTTTVQYTIPVGTKHALSRQNVQLKVYDILGKVVTTLVNKVQSPGSYEVTFDATNLSSGVYYYQLKSGSFVKTKKMIVLK